MKIPKKNVVLFVYVFVLSLIGPLIFWLSIRWGQSSPEATLDQPFADLTLFSRNQLNHTRISLGEQILVTADNSPNKQAGIEAFASSEYAEAYAKFNSSVQDNRNDPETWIYLNNTAAAATGDVVKIAVSVPIGSNLNIAKEILRGVAQAQNEVNKSGGIGGVLLQIEIANDDNDPAIAKQIATEFVNNSEILAVIGHNSSNASIAAAPLYEQGNLVMVSPD